MAQRQLAVPIALERLNAYTKSLRVDIGVEDGRSEVRSRWLFGVVGWDVEMELPHALGEGCMCWTGKEDVELCEIVVV